MTPTIRMTQDNSSFLALDFGQAKVGVARASAVARLAEPYTTLSNDDRLLDQIEAIASHENASLIVVGLPRNLQGLDTKQTAITRSFATEVEERLKLPVVLQDEALTSRQAEAELRAAKKPNNRLTVDSLAAVYILEDYLKNVKV